MGWIPDIPIHVTERGGRGECWGSLSFGSCSLRTPSQEFAVLSELRRLQNECHGYDLQPDPDIQQWLSGLRPLTDAQR
jgi:hypothetical protein